MASGEISPTSACPIRCLTRRVEALTVDQHQQARGVQTSQSRGRTPNGPLPTGVMFATDESASPVDSEFPWRTASDVMVSCRATESLELRARHAPR